ncbi:hypothetical protein Ancab_021680, partial [Ancistrocladus abbreviatus]
VPGLLLLLLFVPLKDGCRFPLWLQLPSIFCCAGDDAVANAVLQVSWRVGGSFVLAGWCCRGWLGPWLFLPRLQFLSVVWLLKHFASLGSPLVFFLHYGFGEDSGFKLTCLCALDPTQTCVSWRSCRSLGVLGSFDEALVVFACCCFWLLVGLFVVLSRFTALLLGFRLAAQFWG